MTTGVRRRIGLSRSWTGLIKLLDWRQQQLAILPHHGDKINDGMPAGRNEG
jgi:hypothetical protein